MSRRPVFAIATAAIALVSLTACGGSSSDSASDTGANPSNQASGSANGSGQGGGSFQGRTPGASGQIAAKSGSTLQVQNQTDGQVAVTYTAKTAISAQVAAKLADVKVGSCVTVTPASSSSSSGSTSGSGSTTAVTAATVRITTAVNGECTGGFGGGFAGGSRPSGFPSGMATSRPTTMPSGGASGYRGGARGFGGANGKVTAVTGTGFTVESSFPSGSGGNSSSSSTSITVTVSGSTTYTTTKTADAAALKVGKCVVATGQSDDTGAVTASRLVVSDPVDGSCSTGFGFGARGQSAGTGSSGQQGGAA